MPVTLPQPSCFTFPEDSLLAVSAAGDLKVWDLSSSVSRIQEKQNIFERECQPLDCTLCSAIRFCTYTERLLLAVFSTCWKVYDYCDFSLLWTELSPCSQTLAGGEILAAHRLIIWTEDGHGYIYQLVNSGLSQSIQPSKGGMLKETVRPVLLSSTEVEDNKSFSYIMGFMNERKEPFYKILYSGQASGRITLWHVPDVPVSTLDGSPKDATAVPHVLSSAGCSGVTTLLVLPSRPVPCWLLSGSQDSCVVWWDLFTGEALHRFVLDAGPIARLLLSPDSCRVSRGSLGAQPGGRASAPLQGRARSWQGERGASSPCFPKAARHVELFPTSLLYLAEEVFLALSLQRKGHRLVCCVCSDHSIILLHVQERTCLLRARKHLFPVTALRWHPMENLLVVGCENDSVYVWDIETGERGDAAPVECREETCCYDHPPSFPLCLGSLERYESGETAKAILSSCEDSGLMADPLYAALEEDGHREKDLGGPLSSSLAFGSFSCSRLAHQRRSFSHQLTTLCWAQGPFAVWPLRATWESISVNILLFDLEKLVELLYSSQANGLKSSNSFSTLDILKRARSTTEKRTLKRNRTSGSLSPVDGQVRVVSEEQDSGVVHIGGTFEQSDGFKRCKKAKSSKKIKRQSSGKTSPTVATEAAKLLLSCFFPWGVNRELDGLCVQYLGILKLFSPVSFGLLSKDNYLTLMLPGWSSANSERVEEQQEVVNLFSSKVLHLHSKYYSVTQEQTDKKDGWRNTVTSTEQRLVLGYLLSRMSLVQRIINSPSEKSSLMKRNKWRPAASLVLDDFNLETSPHMLRFPVCESDNRSFVKLISCWRDQSIEVRKHHSKGLKSPQ
ncbi:hypothetical protein Chor_014620, partial [Crotalus horridus]